MSEKIGEELENNKELRELNVYLEETQLNIKLLRQSVIQKWKKIEEIKNKKLKWLLKIEKYFDDNKKEIIIKDIAFKIEIRKKILKNLNDLIKILYLIAKTEEEGENINNAKIYYKEILALEKEYYKRLDYFIVQNKNFDRKIFEENKVDYYVAESKKKLKQFSTKI